MQLSWPPRHSRVFLEDNVEATINLGYKAYVKAKCRLRKTANEENATAVRDATKSAWMAVRANEEAWAAATAASLSPLETTVVETGSMLEQAIDLQTRAEKMSKKVCEMQKEATRLTMAANSGLQEVLEAGCHCAHSCSLCTWLCRPFRL